MYRTDYQETILVWLYGLQNYQGIFANVPPPPAGIVPPPVSQAPGGEAWIAYSTEAADAATSPAAVQEIPGTAQNDPQAAIWAMPDFVTQIGGTLLLTLEGAHYVEKLARDGDRPDLAEEAFANIETRLSILESAMKGGWSAGDGSPRRLTNTALLARAGYIERPQAAEPSEGDEWVCTAQGRAAWEAFSQSRDYGVI